MSNKWWGGRGPVTKTPRPGKPRSNYKPRIPHLLIAFSGLTLLCSGLLYLYGEYMAPPPELKLPVPSSCTEGQVARGTVSTLLGGTDLLAYARIGFPDVVIINTNTGEIITLDGPTSRVETPNANSFTTEVGLEECPSGSFDLIILTHVTNSEYLVTIRRESQR